MPYRQNEYKGLEKSEDEIIYEKLKLIKWAHHCDDTPFKKFRSYIGNSPQTRLHIVIRKLLWHTSVYTGDITLLKGKYAKKLYKYVKRKLKEEDKEYERLKKKEIIDAINRRI